MVENYTAEPEPCQPTLNELLEKAQERQANLLAAKRAVEALSDLLLNFHDMEDIPDSPKVFLAIYGKVCLRLRQEAKNMTRIEAAMRGKGE